MPLPLFALYLSMGLVDSGQLDVDKPIEVCYHWSSLQIWSAFIGSFFLFIWRNYISCCVVIRFVSYIFRIATELRYYSLVSHYLTNLEGAWNFFSCISKQLRPLCAPKFVPAFEVFLIADSDMGHVNSNVVVFWGTQRSKARRTGRWLPGCEMRRLRIL